MKVSAKSTAITLLKTLIALVSIVFIYLKVNARSDLDKVREYLLHGLESPDKIWIMSVILVLMGMNWFLEAAKWKLLLQSFSPVGWLRSIRSVLSGVTVSIFTPNRIGEFAGRILHLNPGVRIRATIACIIGSMNQLLITVVAGGISLLVSLRSYIEDDFIYRTLYGITIATIVASVFVYFKIPGISRLLSKYQNFRKVSLYTAFFEKYNYKTLFKLTALSAVRYSVFTLQFVLVLYFFDIRIPLFEAVKGVSLMFLFMAIVPSLAISELTTRGSVALFVFSPLTGNSAGILAASTLIWLINLVVPAAFGALAAFYFRFNRST